MRKMSHVWMAGVASMAMGLIFAATALAAGFTPGPVILDIKCYNVSTNSYCGSYSVDAEIYEDGGIDRPLCSTLERKCSERYPDRCPAGSARAEYKYFQGLTCWNAQCNP